MLQLHVPPDDLQGVAGQLSCCSRHGTVQQRPLRCQLLRLALRVLCWKRAEVSCLREIRLVSDSSQVKPESRYACRTTPVTAIATYSSISFCSRPSGSPASSMLRCAVCKHSGTHLRWRSLRAGGCAGYEQLQEWNQHQHP